MHGILTMRLFQWLRWYGKLRYCVPHTLTRRYVFWRKSQTLDEHVC